MKNLEQLLQKAKYGDLTSDEMIHLELLVIELQYRQPEDLTPREQRLLLLYHNYKLRKGGRIYTDAELEERKREAFAKSAAELGLRLSAVRQEAGVGKRLPSARNRVLYKRLIPAFVGAAAVMAFLFMVFHYAGGTGGEVYYADNARAEFRLPDSTLVVMSAGSELTLSPRFNRKQRQVSAKGEIFFDVSHNPQKPFIIHHGDLTTEVKGTSFTIFHYADLDRNTVTVNTGLVRVWSEGRELASLLPNTRLVYSKNSKEHEVSSIDARAHARWMQGDLILNNADLSELTFRLKQHFGKELIVKGNAFGERVSITGEFAAGMKPEQVMESLVLIYGIHYRVDNASIIVW